MKAGWRDTPLAPPDLGEAICENIEKYTNARRYTNSKKCRNVKKYLNV